VLNADLDIREEVPLAPLTTLGVGGKARFFAAALHPGDVECAVAFTRKRKLPLFVLGGGSNLVISDRGFAGLVLQIGIGGIEERGRHGKLRFDAGAGCPWDGLVAQSVSRNCGGLECLSGIPGSVGGTPVQNVGAYGQEASETIVSVLVYDRAESRIRELTRPDCAFGYRTSVFNSRHRDRYIIVRVRYELLPDAEPALRYADLQRHFAQQAKPTLAGVREAVLQIRARKGMVIRPGDPDSRSAGSFFKNPVLPAGEFERLKRKAAECGLELPSYPALSRQNKISAAWLVENSGFHKGYQKGTVAISSKHALAIVSRDGARAADVIALGDEIQARVEQAWGVRLEPEPVLVGF
jgi:UDP-N-acetylmuramate dehydrogenase